MDPRRPSRVIDPKVRKVGFFTPGPPPDRTRSGPAATTPTQSPVSNTLSPVMIPPARHASDNLSRAVGMPVPVASQLHAHPPVDSLQVGSYTLSDSVFSASPTRSPSSRIGLDGEFSEDSVNWLKRSNSGRFTAAIPTGGPDDESSGGLVAEEPLQKNSQPLKAKTTKAERRALQEAQRAAKATAKDSSSDSDSDSSASTTNEFDEWIAGVFRQNLRVNRIIEDMIISSINLSLGDGPSKARKKCRDREYENVERRLMEDYFVDNPTYDQVIFRRIFRMQRPLFHRIVVAVTANDEYFLQRPDATGRQGLSPLQKCTRAMRVLAYGSLVDVVDEYLRMSEYVTREALMNFVEGVISCFGDEYLRKPNEDDLARLLYVGEQRGFPGMIGCIDCMHWELKNCPTAWAEQYAGKSGKPTIILEVVASYDLWIWHALFGTQGSRSDINVLNRSPNFNDVLEGRAPKVSYVVNGHERNMAYYLTDGIYPSWAAFLKSIISPQLRKHKLFAQHHDAIRKDVERAFRVLQARFAFLRHPCLVLDKHEMGRIMLACIIMHNMIVEDERETYENYDDPTEFLNDMPTNRQQGSSTEDDDDQPFEYSIERIANLSRYMTNREQLRNREAHSILKNDLIEHIWRKFGTDN